MKNEFLYLTYYQVMSFMYGLHEMKKENPYFNDTIAASFSNYVIKRTEEIALTYPRIKLKIIPNADKYKVSKSLVIYLSNLTGIDVLDEATVKRYIPIIKEAEKCAVDEIIPEEIKKLEKNRSIR